MDCFQSGHVPCALIQDILGFHCNFRFTDALLVLWSEKAVDGGVFTLQSSYCPMKIGCFFLKAGQIKKVQGQVFYMSL